MRTVDGPRGLCRLNELSEGTLSSIGKDIRPFAMASGVVFGAGLCCLRDIRMGFRLCSVGEIGGIEELRNVVFARVVPFSRILVRMGGRGDLFTAFGLIGGTLGDVGGVAFLG